MMNLHNVQLFFSDALPTLGAALGHTVYRKHIHLIRQHARSQRARLLNVRGADGLFFNGNEIQHSTSYPRHREDAGHLKIEHCSRFDLEACAENSTGTS
jgi:hypothetical protein